MSHFQPAAWLFGGALLMQACASTAAADDLKPFPAAQPGQNRYVIRVPAVERPDEHKLELLIGKQMMVDCNRVMMGATLSTETAKGWGFDYFVLGPLGPAASTMMACPPGVPKRDEFVRANLSQPGGKGEAGLLRYNPKVPVVVYVPDGVEVRWRVWKAGESGSAKRE